MLLCTYKGGMLYEYKSKKNKTTLVQLYLFLSVSTGAGIRVWAAASTFFMRRPHFYSRNKCLSTYIQALYMILDYIKCKYCK